jgi:hypothetical protein
MGNGQGLFAEPVPWMNQNYSLSITLPPLAGVVIERNAGG